MTKKSQLAKKIANSFLILLILGSFVFPQGYVYAEEESEVQTTTATASQIAISDELGGDTDSDGGVNPPDSQSAVADEGSFTTNGDTPTNSQIAISDELSFTTDKDGGSGGGSSGSRRRSSGSIRPIPEVAGEEVLACPRYLNEYIKYGANNNPIEVWKLQVFLRYAEGFQNQPINSVYDQVTYQNVRLFQERYNRDVLGPWRISESTGYVFITTSLAINNIYCQRSTANNLDLSNFYPHQAGATYNSGFSAYGKEAYLPVSVGEIGEGTSTMVVLGTLTTTGTTSLVASTGFWQAAAVGLLNFINFHPGWWLLILILLAVIILVIALWKIGDEDNDVLPKGQTLTDYSDRDQADYLAQIDRLASKMTINNNDNHHADLLDVEEVAGSSLPEADEEVITSEDEEVPLGVAAEEPKQPTLDNKE